MRDAFGGAVNVLFIAIFIAIVNGYLAFTANYNKAFRIKNRIISLIEQNEGYDSSNENLKEKIKEILTPYPDPMSRNDFRIACHIGTRTSLYLLQSGLVPCKNNGKKTRCYKIAKKDVAEYLYRRESDPMRYTPPSGWYYNYPKHKKPAASLERKLNYKGEERLLAKEWYEQQLANYPDVLTVAQVCEVTGYQRHTILKWCSKGLLKTILQTPKYMIPKVWLLEFVTSDFFNEIGRKCGKHYAAIKEISGSRKAR